MAFTGEATLIAGSNGYGQGEGEPRGVAGDDTHVYVIGNTRKRLIRVTNLDTFASEYASTAFSGATQSLAFLEGNAYVSVGTALHRISAPLSDSSVPTQLTGTLPSDVFSLTSDGTALYAYKRTDDTIHRITIAGSAITVTAFATVTFPVGVSTNIRAFFYYENAFYFVNLSDNLLYKSPDNVVSGSTVAATQVGNFTNFGVGAADVHGAGVLGGNAYIASGSTDNLYRFYNVRWDATIAAIEVDEEDSRTFDLTGVSQDATSFAFVGTPPSWITLSGTTLTITNAPAVTADTDFTVTVRATRGSVTVDKTLTVRVIAVVIVPATPVPKLLLFKRLNRTATPTVAGNNDYSTYTTQNTVRIAIDKAGVAQAFDTLFFKMMNVTSYIVRVDGVALPARTVPEYLTEVSELGNVSILRHGYQHDLYELASDMSGSMVEITFSGSNIRVNEVWALKKIASLHKLNKFVHSQVDRDAMPQTYLHGYDETDVITGFDRLRWQSDIELEFTHTDMNHEVFLDLIEDYAEEGIVVAQEPYRLPWRTYWAIFSKLQHAAPYLSTSRSAGNTVQLMIDETRAAAALWYTLETFNSNASGDGLMFFKPCTHLLQNGAVDDNDYKTFSAETTHTFDVEAVSHIFVKAKGVTAYQVQTLVSNAWMTQETITPIQKTYRGYDNSVTQLTTRIVADQVRLVFTGNPDIEIYEVMCLDRGGEILTETQSLLSKTDRTGIVREGQGGVLNRSRVMGSERMKWDIGIQATFGHFDDFVVDDVLDWINAYPNFVFSYLPNETPWRTFPATWTDQRFQQAFLTTVLQHGDYLQMNVKER